MKTDATIHYMSRIREKVNEKIQAELERAGAVGLVPSHGDLLLALYEREPMTMTELADRIHRDRSTVTTLIGKLKKQGYVDVQKNPDDARSNCAYLTAKGRALHPIFVEISEALYNQEYQGISREERELFVRLLEKVHANFQ